MDPSAYLNHRVIQQRTEEAARRAEYARAAAEHPERLAPRPGIVLLIVRVLAVRRAADETR